MTNEEFRESSGTHCTLDIKVSSHWYYFILMKNNLLFNKMSQQHNVQFERCRTAGGSAYIFFVNMNIVDILLYILLIRFWTTLTHLNSVLLTLWIRTNPSRKYCIGRSLTSTLSSIVWTSAKQWHEFSRVSVYTVSVYICLLLCRPTLLCSVRTFLCTKANRQGPFLTINADSIDSCYWVWH